MLTTVNNAPSVFADLMLTDHLSNVCTLLLDRVYLYIKFTVVLDKRQVIYCNFKVIVIKKLSDYLTVQFSYDLRKH